MIQRENIEWRGGRSPACRAAGADLAAWNAWEAKAKLHRQILGICCIVCNDLDGWAIAKG